MWMLVFRLLYLVLVYIRAYVQLSTSCCMPYCMRAYQHIQQQHFHIAYQYIVNTKIIVCQATPFSIHQEEREKHLAHEMHAEKSC